MPAPKPILTFDEWADFVNAFTGPRHPALRLGQHAYNTLYELNSSVARAINATGFDPFYNDKLLRPFLCHLLTNFVEDPVSKEGLNGH